MIPVNYCRRVVVVMCLMCSLSVIFLIEECIQIVAQNRFLVQKYRVTEGRFDAKQIRIALMGSNVTKRTSIGNTSDYIHRDGAIEHMEIGTVNYDVWSWMSGYLVDDMRLWWSFPKYPEESKTLTTLTVSYSERTGESNFRGKYAHKVYGYLLPPKSASYIFQIAMTNLSCWCEVELWLSTSKDPLQIKNVVFLEHRYSNTSTLISSSEPIKLSSNHSYYFEFLEKAFDGEVVVEIKWSYQHSGEFASIPSSSIARTTSLSTTVRKLGDDLPSSKLQRHIRLPPLVNNFGSVTDLDILPPCEFNAKYAYKHTVFKYGGVEEVVYSKVFPFDRSNITDNLNGETPTISEDLVDRVIRLYGEELKKQYLYATYKLIRMEETENWYLGSRILLEMELNMKEQDSPLHISEYVYLQANSNQLCATSNFKWNPGARVYLIVAIKDVGNWAHQLLYNIEQIYAATKDNNFDVVFVDFESTDINLNETIQTSSFKRCHHITLQGKFSRAGGLQAALQYITDLDSIVMAMDLHLYIPVGFIDSIRKHVIQGKMAYAPVLVRLGKGYSEVNINGFWEVQGYGIYGMYRSDWEAIGGFSTDEYKFNWGGEDWDIVDKAAGYGLETFRLRYPGFVHYFHTYGELWGNQNNETIISAE